MDKITEVFATYRNPIYIGVTVFIILVVLYYVATRTKYLHFMKMGPQEQIQPQVQPQVPVQSELPNETFGTGTIPEQEQTKIIIFFAPWCPHCKNMMDGEDSLWEKLKQKHGQRKDLVIDQVNCDEQPDLATKFGIKGFPTIMKIKKDIVETFEGDRTLDALEGFIGSY